MMSNSLFYLLAFTSLWLIAVYKYQKKRGCFDAGSLILISYTVYSVASIFIYVDPEMGGMQLSLFPFIYLFLMVILAASPVLKFDLRQVEIIPPSRVVLQVFCYIFIISSFIRIPFILPHIYQGIFRILTDSSAGLDIYKDTMDMVATSGLGDAKIASLPAVISGVFCDLGVLVFFYYLTLPDMKKWVAICLAISCLYIMFQAIADSQRGPVIDRLFTYFVTYLFLKSKIPPKINKVLKRIGLVIIGLVALTMISITISRFGDDAHAGMTTSQSFWGYVGQENINFDRFAFDNNGYRYGDRVFPLFKRMIGLDAPRNFYERRMMYPNLKINDEVFIGFVGDFCLDFGPIITFFIFSFFTFFVIAQTRNLRGEIGFHKIVLLHFVMCICMQGGMKLWSFADMNNLRIIVVFLAFFLFRPYDNLSGERL